MQLDQDIPLPREDDNTSDNYGLHLDEKSTLGKQDIKKYHKNEVSKSLDTRCCVKDGLLRHTPQNELLASKLSLFLRKIRFSEQEFFTSIPLLDIKYYYLSSQNDNFFYLFNNQLDYTQSNYFIESKTIKGNVDQFLFNSLIVLLTKKLSDQNSDK